MTTQQQIQRRVLLLETDERAGLVAAIADVCRDRRVSLEITTGPGHVLITLAASDNDVDLICADFHAIEGVNGVHPYAVATA